MALSRLATVTYLVPDYSEAIAWFTGVLGFRLLQDLPQGPAKRWVVVAPGEGRSGAALLLARAANAEQQALVGRQAGGRVFLFLETDNFHVDHAALSARGLHFLETPRHEPYGWVAVFEDRYGNKWDLLEQPATT
jgi:catechol 2,3-dioxygenase-like lactoylglutathione lyase family enzyme